MTFPRILAALAAAFLGLVPVGAGAQTISGGGGVPAPYTQPCATVSVSTVCWGVTETWNASGTVFAAPLQVAVTDTASAAGSLIFNVLGGASASTSEFSVSKSAVAMIAAAGVYSIGSDTGMSRCGASVICFGNGAQGTSNAGIQAAWEATTFSSQSGATYSVAGDSSLIFTSASTVTLTLPTANGFPGRILRLKTTGGAAVNSATSNVVPLAGGAAGTAILTTTAGKWAELQSDGTNWVIMAAN